MGLAHRPNPPTKLSLSEGGSPTRPGDHVRSAVEVASQASAPSTSGVDALMERASTSLAHADYFGTIEFCLRAVIKCVRSEDWGTLARVALPLQEARRQLRQISLDASAQGGKVITLLPSRGVTIEPGCYLLDKPLIGLDGRTFREMARARKVAVLALVKEPTTRAGLWPIVGVGEGQPLPVVARVQVAPPTDASNPDAAWFAATHEALGDAAIAKVEAMHAPADHRVLDYLEFLDAVPDHEKLAQALAATCREATTSARSLKPRRRPMLDDPYSF